MLNAVNVPIQTVNTTQNVLFANTRITTNSCAMRHESGSGVVTLLCPGIYEVEFSGTVATATAGEMVINITAEGDAIAGAQVSLTAAATTNYDVTKPTLVRVYREGNVRVAVRNDSAFPITVTNASLIVKRLC